MDPELALAPNHFDAFLTRTGGPRVKLNAKGEGFIGGIDPPMVAYQQIANGQSNLKLYNADTQTRSNPPAGVNTAAWEWEPSISGDWLLFGRQTSSTQLVILHSLTTRTSHPRPGPRFRHPGQVNGDFAAWTRCRRACDVVRRQISSVNDTVLQKPATKFQYGGGVTSTGIVYVARSGPKCGGDVKVVRYFGATDPAGGTIVADLGPTGATSGAPTRGTTTTGASTSSTTATSAARPRPTSTASTTRTPGPKGYTLDPLPADADDFEPDLELEELRVAREPDLGCPP